MKYWCAAIFLVVYFATGKLTYAHQAPSGWDYPISCCSGNDCFRIEANEVEANRDGSYTIKLSGETFFPPNVPASKNFKWSGDTDFHRCTYTTKNDATTSICLFVPQPGV